MKYGVIVLLLPMMALAEVPIRPALVPKRSPLTHRVRAQSGNEELMAQNPELQRIMQDPEAYKREMKKRIADLKNSMAGSIGRRKGGDPAKALEDGHLEKAASGKLTPEQLQEMKRGLKEAMRMQRSLQRELERLQSEGKTK